MTKSVGKILLPALPLETTINWTKSMKLLFSDVGKQAIWDSDPKRKETE